jgi:type III secretion protein N (ATPase)
MTAIYTVLTENDGVGDPIGEEVMSLTDGHITLSGKLGQSGHYPAVDVLRSKSRLFSELSSPQHAAAASKARALLAKYQEIELLIQVGEYKAGGDALADEAVRKRDQLNAFLRQDSHSRSGFNETLEALMALAK